MCGAVVVIHNVPVLVQLSGFLDTSSPSHMAVAAGFLQGMSVHAHRVEQKLSNREGNGVFKVKQDQERGRGKEAEAKKVMDKEVKRIICWGRGLMGRPLFRRHLFQEPGHTQRGVSEEGR